jgi:diguanylate cyclase (GGDEF)-like protein
VPVAQRVHAPADCQPTPDADEPVKQTMALAAQPDLATRLKQAQHGLRVRLEDRGTLLEVLHATQAACSPQAVAEFLIGWTPRFLPLHDWAVLAGEPGHPVTVLGHTAASPVIQAASAVAVERVLGSARPLLVGDLSREAPALPSVACLAFPLSVRDRIVAVLVGCDDSASGADPDLRPEVLTAWMQLLEVAGFALEKALLLHRAEELSVTDDLTRLYNSRYLNQALRREVKRVNRGGKPLSLLFLDLDGFKQVNDSHGHLHGSRALVEAAAVIKRSSRETDVVARFGGDEFAIVLPDTDTAGALAVAARICDRIAAHRFLADEQLDIRLTVSVGVATLPPEGGSADELVRSADQAMYQVKASGKNGIQLSAGGSTDT